MRVRNLFGYLAVVAVVGSACNVQVVQASTRHQTKAEQHARKAAPARSVKKAPAPAKKKAVQPEPLVDAQGNPRIQSTAFYVQDLHTGEILLQKNPEAVQPIASITKLMTVMVVLDARQDMKEIIEISNDDIDRLKGTSSHLPVGTRLSREDMMHLALMASENRAASALGRNYPGGMAAFLEAMNVKARMMGLHDTHFYDGTGLTKSNVSSARDLAIMVSNASKYPLIREFSTSAEYSVRLGGGRERTFHNTNSLVKSPDWQIEVSKTGYISESGKCLVMQAWMMNRPLVIVLLDSWGKFTRIGDANRIKRWLESSLPKHHLALNKPRAVVN